jgi:hypothetical protein
MSNHLLGKQKSPKVKVSHTLFDVFEKYFAPPKITVSSESTINTVNSFNPDHYQISQKFLISLASIVIDGFLFKNKYRDVKYVLRLDYHDIKSFFMWFIPKVKKSNSCLSTIFEALSNEELTELDLIEILFKDEFQLYQIIGSLAKARKDDLLYFPLEDEKGEIEEPNNMSATGRNDLTELEQQKRIKYLATNVMKNKVRRMTETKKYSGCVLSDAMREEMTTNLIQFFQNFCTKMKTNWKMIDDLSRQNLSNTISTQSITNQIISDPVVTSTTVLSTSMTADRTLLLNEHEIVNRADSKEKLMIEYVDDFVVIPCDTKNEQEDIIQANTLNLTPINDIVEPAYDYHFCVCYHHQPSVLALQIVTYQYCGCYVSKIRGEKDQDELRSKEKQLAFTQKILHNETILDQKAQKLAQRLSANQVKLFENNRPKAKKHQIYWKEVDIYRHLSSFLKRQRLNLLFWDYLQENIERPKPDDPRLHLPYIPLAFEWYTQTENQILSYPTCHKLVNKKSEMVVSISANESSATESEINSLITLEKQGSIPANLINLIRENYQGMVDHDRRCYQKLMQQVAKLVHDVHIEKMNFTFMTDSTEFFKKAKRRNQKSYFQQLQRDLKKKQNR